MILKLPIYKEEGFYRFQIREVKMTDEEREYIRKFYACIAGLEILVNQYLMDVLNRQEFREKFTKKRDSLINLFNRWQILKG